MKKHYNSKARWLLSSVMLALCTLFASLPSFAQTMGTVAIGSGTATTQYLPDYTYFGYNYSQQIVKSTEFTSGGGAAGQITAIRYYVGTALEPYETWENWTIYIGHTANASFASATAWVPVANMTQVFAGTVSPVDGEWMEIVFDTPFVYDGTSNLVVAVHENSEGYNDGFSGSLWGAYSAGTDTGLYYSSDTVDPDPMGDTPLPAGVRVASVPRLQFNATKASCLAPTDLNAPAIANNTATIEWVAPATAPSGGYEYYLSTTNSAPTAVTPGIDVATTTLSLSGLPANTPHYLWVRSDCGGANNYSAWSPALTFTTTCDAVNAPYTQAFTTGVQPSCWGNSSTVNAGNALWKFAGFVEYDNGNTRPEGTFAWVDGSDPSDGVNDVTLTSVPINIATVTTPQLVFDYFSNNLQEETYPNNTFNVEVYNGTTWTNVYSDNTSLAAWRTITVPLTGYTGIIQVRFIVDKTNAPVGYAFYNDILLDNVIVQQTPACAPPTGLLGSEITDSGFEFEWTASSSNPTGGYEFEVRSAGLPGSGATGLGDSGTTTGTAETFTGLMPNTPYKVYVRANCGAGIYSDWASADVTTIPTPPANDDCDGAIALTVNPSFTCTAVTAGTTVSASNSMDATPCYGNPDDDVWFTFVATHESHAISLLNVVAVTGTSTDMNIQVLSGTCDALESILCSDPETTMATGLTPGETYYVRIYSWYDSKNTFNICIGSPPSPPANDDCEDAVSLTVNPDYSCAASATGTTAGATNSMEAAPCFGNPDDDVWYSFVAVGESHNVRLSGITAVTGGSTDMYMQVLSGACGSMESVKCSDPESTSLIDLTPGETYYIRVYSYGTGLNNFTICVGTPPAAPVNDDCENAVVLTVNPDVNCAVTTAGTTASATQTMASTPCFGNPDDDVWYQFTATADVHVIGLSNIVAVEGGGTDMYIQVLSGVCGTMESLECSDPESVTADNLVPGEVYYVRVYSYYGDTRNNFSICVGTIPAPPANDDCDAPIALTAGGTFATNPVVVSNGGATATTGVPAPGCADYQGGDVWYSVAIPASGSLTVETNSNTGSGITDAGLALYSGTCGSLALIECDDDDSNDGAFSLVTVTGRTPGEIIFIRAWEYGNNAYGTFRLSAYHASLSNNKFDLNGFSHYPNPVKDVLNISHTSDITSVSVYNMLGQQVLAKEFNATEAAVDMSALAGGAYIVNVTANNATKTIKVVKQ